MTLIKNEWAYFDDVLNIRYPWYTSGCLNWLASIDLVGKRVFEYGVGNSTLWYRSRGAIVAGVDSNLEWLERVGGAQCETSFYPYVTSIEQYKPFDIVVIDGLFRDDCTMYAMERTVSGGHIIIDNYKQPSVQADWPVTEKLIEGMEIQYFKEPNHPDWVTIVITMP